MLKSIYSTIKDNDLIKCYKAYSRDKVDFIININNQEKYFSLKMGNKNSIHTEYISDFIVFLRSCGLKTKPITFYKNFHYGRQNTTFNIKEYEHHYAGEIKYFNVCINKDDILEKAYNRFLFTGLNNSHIVDYIIYGTIDNFIYASRTDIINYLMKENDNTIPTIHFGLLIVQPLTRNLGFNIKQEKHINFIQVKWYSLRHDMYKIWSNKNN
jgi:hypothetical protein